MWLVFQGLFKRLGLKEPWKQQCPLVAPSPFLWGLSRWQDFSSPVLRSRGGWAERLAGHWGALSVCPRRHGAIHGPFPGHTSSPTLVGVGSGFWKHFGQNFTLLVSVPVREVGQGGGKFALWRFFLHTMFFLRFVLHCLLRWCRKKQYAWGVIAVFFCAGFYLWIGFFFWKELWFSRCPRAECCVLY